MALGVAQRMSWWQQCVWSWKIGLPREVDTGTHGWGEVDFTPELC